MLLQRRRQIYVLEYMKKEMFHEWEEIFKYELECRDIYKRHQSQKVIEIRKEIIEKRRVTTKKNNNISEGKTIYKL